MKARPRELNRDCDLLEFKVRERGGKIKGASTIYNHISPFTVGKTLTHEGARNICLCPYK